MCARQPPRRRAGLPGAPPVACALFVLLLACAVPARADEYDHKYAVGDRVILWENKVGPYNNPQETYNYHELPFCRVETATDEKPTHKWGGLGEILQGNELIDSGVEFKFRVDQPKTTLCVDVLTQKSAKVFKRAVRKHYWYEFVMDDLPIWGFVGETWRAPPTTSTRRPSATTRTSPPRKSPRTPRMTLASSAAVDRTVKSRRTCSDTRFATHITTARWARGAAIRRRL